jgi:hypothetical protein
VPGVADDNGTENRGSDAPGIEGVVNDGSARFGINCDALGGDVVEGLTNDGSAKFGASPDTLGTVGEAEEAAIDGSARFGINCDALGGNVVEGLTNDGSAKFGASPDTFGTVGELEGVAMVGTPVPPNGNETKGAEIDGIVVAGTPIPELTPGDVPPGMEVSPRGITPKRPDTRPVASPI